MPADPETVYPTINMVVDDFIGSAYNFAIITLGTAITEQATLDLSNPDVTAATVQISTDLELTMEYNGSLGTLRAIPYIYTNIQTGVTDYFANPAITVSNGADTYYEGSRNYLIRDYGQLLDNNITPLPTFTDGVGATADLEITYYPVTAHTQNIW